jgi:hypothetical protein
MQIPMEECKIKLATTWFVGSGFVFLILVLQTIFGRFGDGEVSEAWGWLLPSIMPTLSLILSVLVMDAQGTGTNKRTVDRFLFRLSFGLSLAYLIIVASVILLRYFAPYKPLELMKLSNYWLGPLQGLVIVAVGVFFVKKEPE